MPDPTANDPLVLPCGSQLLRQTPERAGMCAGWRLWTAEIPATGPLRIAGLAVGGRAHPRAACEKAREVRRVVEPQIEGDLRHWQGRVDQAALGLEHEAVVQDGLRRPADGL